MESMEFKELLKAAEQGDPKAQVKLGECYQDGEGVSFSYEKAAEWFTKAADQGDYNASCCLQRILKYQERKKEILANLIEYQESFGEVKFPEGFSEKLQGKSIEEQMEFFRISDSKCYSVFHGREDFCQYTSRLEQSNYIQGLVVRNGVLVGAKISGDICLPEDGTCVYYAREENGAGYKELELFEYFVCFDH